jgi:hypothetical protein
VVDRARLENVRIRAELRRIRPLMVQAAKNATSHSTTAFYASYGLAFAVLVKAESQDPTSYL